MRQRNLSILFSIYILLLGAFGAFGASPAGFLPLISNYPDSEYKGKLQNWSATQDSNGVCYFANSAGLLSYDGYTWQLHPLPSKNIVRSVYAGGDKIYVGSFEDFGYFAPDKYGELRYTSLKERNKGVKFSNEEVWFIIPYQGKLIFQTFSKMYLYDPKSGKIELMEDKIALKEEYDGDSRLNPLRCFPVGKKLFAQRSAGSFFYLDRGGWRRLWTKEEIGSHIMEIITPENSDPQEGGLPEGTLLFSQSNLIYIIKNGKLNRFYTDFDAELKNSQINRVIKGEKGTVYIGTIGDGIFQIDSAGRGLMHIGRSEGLQNNTILGMMLDADKNIWLCLDDGISQLHTGAPFSILIPGASDSDIGMPYSIGKSGQTLLVATNQGAYSFDNAKGNFHLFENTKGHNWFVKTLDNQTILGGNDQTIVLNPDGSRTLIPSSATDLKRGVIHGKEVAVQTTYYPLQLYTRTPEHIWKYDGIIEGFNAPGLQVEIDNDGSLWITHFTAGLYHVKLSNDLKRVARKVYYSNLAGDSVPSKCVILKIRGRIFFNQNDVFYTYNEEGDVFEPMGTLNQDLGKLRDIKMSEMIDDNRFWLAGSEYYSLIEFDGQNYRILYTIPLSIFPRSANGDNSGITRLEDGECLFTFNKGVGRINVQEINQFKHKNHPLRILSASSFDNEGNLRAMPVNLKERTELPASNLVVRLSFPNYSGRNVRFRFVDGKGKNRLDTIVQTPEMVFPVLRSGKHDLTCTVIDENGDEIDTLTYSFDVPLPRPLRWWAILIYIAILIAVVAIVVRISNNVAIRRRKREFDAAKAEKDRMIHEQERVIAEQQKRLLESELTTKSKELASMALGAVAREQVIENMKASIADLRRKGNTSAQAEKVLKEITRTESDNSQFWDIFERNFDLIHIHYFHNLRKEYPALTASDLKFCALLRMNLTTKEIAKISNISVRGVETARYRLRKKFNLSAEQSLVQFLIDFAPGEVDG